MDATAELNFPLFQTIGTQMLRRTTPLLDQTIATPLDVSGALRFTFRSFLPTDMRWTRRRRPQRETWLRAILPLAVLSSFSLVLGNLAYVHLSVSFVQILKVMGEK
jgi:hypothetical protein